MKLTASIFLLLFPFLAQAAELQQCPNLRNADGTAVYCDGENNPDCCGPTLTDATGGAGLTATGVDGAVTTDKTGFTMRGCTHPKDTPPTAAQLASGASPCLDTQTVSVSAPGRVDFNTGNGARFTVVAETEYEVSYAHDTGRGKQQVITTTPFTTLASAGGGGADLTGTGYFVDSVSGNDSNNGTSPASPWKTIAKVNNSVTVTGSNVYFATDSVFEDERLVVDWNGVDGDMVEIDTYCIDTSDGNKPKAWTSGGTGCGEKAEINGTFEPACAAADPVTCELDTASAVPSSHFSGIIDLGDNARYIHIKNLIGRDSAGRGLDMKAPQNVVFEGIEMYHTAFPTFMVEREQRYVVGLNNVSEWGNMAEYAEDQNRQHYTGNSFSNAWASAQPSCFKAGSQTSGKAYSLYAGNRVSNCSGEAYGMGSSKGIWFEQNVGHDTGVTFYADHGEYIYVLRSLAAGDTVGPGTNQSGGALAAEPTATDRGHGFGSQRALYAYVITSGTKLGVGIRNVGASTATAGYDVWGLFWHNTMLYPIDEGISVQGGGASAITSDTTFRNNVVVVDASAPEICDSRTNNPSFDYTSWSKALTGANTQSRCSGSNDTVGGLTTARTQSEYTNITLAQATTDWDLADFKVTGSNEDAGEVLSVPSWATTDLAESGWDFAKQYDGNGYFMWGRAGCTVEISTASLLTGAGCGGLDASPDIGAVQ